MTSLINVTSRERYPDPAKRWAITKRTMRLYLAVTKEIDKDARDDYADWTESLEPVESDWQYMDRLQEVRDHAVEEWEGNGGSNCTEGTARFLEAFGLEPLETTTCKRVRVTATITFYVENDADIDATYYDVQKYLRLDVSGRVDDMGNADVEIDNVEVEED